MILERIFNYMFNCRENISGKSRYNQNFDHFHPSTHTYAKVTIRTHCIYECIGTSSYFKVI